MTGHVASAYVRVRVKILEWYTRFVPTVVLIAHSFVRDAFMRPIPGKLPT